jgi:hypothetical protein
MDKTFTLLDIQHYLLEINLLDNNTLKKAGHNDGPSRMTIQNLLRYSSALNVLSTTTIGNVYRLAN